MGKKRCPKSSFDVFLYFRHTRLDNRHMSETDAIISKESMKKCGYIAIIGCPNVGKSTLLNYILQHKISITTRKPQTTRHRITGIKTHNNIQFIYLDTPGLHQNTPRAINRFMNQQADNVINDVDVILFVVALGHYSDQDQWILQKIQSTKTPVILVINKVDQLNNRNDAQIFADKIMEAYQFSAVFLISAKQGHCIEALEDKITTLLPESAHFLFAEDQLSDRTERFMVAEIIREKLMRTLGQEVPYQLTVEIQSYQYNKAKNLIEIDAMILVERSGQKAMVIGKKGQKLKEIGTDARHDIEKLLAKKVFLRLWVKVKEGWSDDARALKSLGYD